MAICSLCLIIKFFQICNLEVLNQGVVAMSETENSDFPRENFNNISESDVRCSSFSAELMKQSVRREPMQEFMCVPTVQHFY